MQRKGTRLEAFTDAAFAFALTLLAIGGDAVPGSIAELRQSLHFIPAFLASATLLLMFWHAHMSWSRDFDTGRGAATLLTMALVCVVLIYVYPMRLMFGAMFAWMTRGALNPGYDISGIGDLSELYLIYATGYLAMCLCIWALYRHSLACADALGLDAEKRATARAHCTSYLLLASPGVICALVVLMSPLRWQPFAPLCYALLGVVMPLFSRHVTRNWPARLAAEQRRMPQAVTEAG